MRRFFGRLANGLRQTTRARGRTGDARRASLQVEALEQRQLLSGSPLFTQVPTLYSRAPVDPILAKYLALGGSSGFLGKSTTGEIATQYGGGLYEEYQGGTIYWSAATGAHDLYGAIDTRFFVTAGEKDTSGNAVQKVLGLPTQDEQPVPGLPGALMATFQGGTIYCPGLGGAADAHAVYGPVAAKYASLGGPAGYGLPISEEADLPGVPGVRVSYFQNGGSILWSAATGAHAIYGAIGAKYTATASQHDAYGTIVQKILGAPTSDEMTVFGVPGARMQPFQGGTIYWSPSTGARVVYGAIAAEYAATVNERGGSGDVVQVLLGLPTSDEKDVPGVPGARMNTFQGGTIYWSPATGAHVVYGAIRDAYNNYGGPASRLGLPTGDEFTDPRTGTIRVAYFQYGVILFNPDLHSTYVILNGSVSFGW